jgi:hypothetical protein
MLQIIDTLLAVLVGGVIWLIYEHFTEKMSNRAKDNYSKMKQRLLKLLQKDGYKCEMEEGVVLLHYHQENFRIHFSDSNLGSRYARVTVVDDYGIDKMDELHPFVMDALMGRATYRNTRISNLSFEDHCTCFSGTDVIKIKDFYRGLPRILDGLMANENVVRQDFKQYHADFGRKKEPEEEKHIGFKRASDEASESVHQVAAETNVSAQ